MASILHKGQSTVQYWASSGRIPAKWQVVLIDLAKKENVQLTAEDFIAPGMTLGDGKPTRERTITGAIKLILRDSREPLALNDIFNRIVEGNLYIFNADNPLGVLHTNYDGIVGGLISKALIRKSILHYTRGEIFPSGGGCVKEDGLDRLQSTPHKYWPEAASQTVPGGV